MGRLGATGWVGPEAGSGLSETGPTFGDAGSGALTEHRSAFALGDLVQRREIGGRFGETSAMDGRGMGHGRPTERKNGPQSLSSRRLHINQYAKGCQFSDNLLCNAFSISLVPTSVH